MDNAARPWVQQTTFMKSTQIAGTESLLNVLGYTIDQNPGPVLVAMPTREAAQEYCETRVKPMVELSTALRAQLGQDRSDSKKRMLKFRRCTVMLRTARVATELSQHAIQHLFGDEVDQWIGDVNNEGNPWTVALERTRTFKGRWKAWLNSTPTVPEGLVHRSFLAGDQRRFHVQCLHCDKWIVFEWEQVRWDKAITDPEQMRQQKAAHYECQECGGTIDDQQKLAICRRGFWVPKDHDPEEWLAGGRDRDRATHRSYHIWAAYSPWIDWWEIVAKYLSCLAEGAENVFWNKWLGLPYRAVIRVTEEGDLERCRRGYHRGEVPAGVQFITCGIDTQEHYLPYSIRGWGLDGRNWLLEHGRADSFEELDGIVFRRDWSGGDARRSGLFVMLTIVDSRWREKDSADFARRWGSHLVRLSKAAPMQGAVAFTMKRLDRHPVTGELLKEGLLQASLNTNLFKGRLAASIATGAEGEGPNAFSVYADIDERYVHEMTAEELTVVEGARGSSELWVKKMGRRANHFWDTEVLNFAAARMLLIDQMHAEQQRAQERGDAEQPPRRRPRGDDDDDGPLLWRRQ